ncbi:MAG: amidohydrolase family protein, partial [Alphaproteobacteria bacterium]|nr:amidohydrolase family protein [Alphaproteobacteria bacterium]
ILHATGMDEEALEAVVARKVPLVPTFTFQANLIDYGDKVGADRFVQDLFRREIADSAETLRRAHKAGVPLLCGSESGFSITPYGDWHWKELEVFVRDIGLTPLETVRCATAEGARAMKMEGRIGEIAPGRLADVIGIAGDPSTDVTVLGDRERIKFVMAGGRSIDLAPDEPARRPIAGWRVGDYGRILTRDVAR